MKPSIFNFCSCNEKKLKIKEILLTARRHKDVYKDYIMWIPSTKLTYLSAIENYPLLWNKRLEHASLKHLVSLLKTKFKEEKIYSA